MPAIKEIERTEDKKEGVTSNKPLTTDEQQFEGATTLKRYLDDSTL